jgi:hypothetical protein
MRPGQMANQNGMSETAGAETVCVRAYLVDSERASKRVRWLTALRRRTSFFLCGIKVLGTLEVRDRENQANANFFC